MTSEKLIEEAAKAMANAPHAASWDAHSDDEREWYRKDAAIALAVFEKAHTSADDDREALWEVLTGINFATWTREEVRDEILAAGFRRTEVREPSADDVAAEHQRHADARRAETMTLISHAEPQGEPSDAEVREGDGESFDAKLRAATGIPPRGGASGLRNVFAISMAPTGSVAQEVSRLAGMQLLRRYSPYGDLWWSRLYAGIEEVAVRAAGGSR